MTPILSVVMRDLRRITLMMRFAGIATWILIARDGRMYKEDIRRVYDGSIFYEIAARREKKSQ